MSLNVDRRVQYERDYHAGLNGYGFGFSPGAIQGRRDRALRELSSKSAPVVFPSNAKRSENPDPFNWQPETKKKGGGGLLALLLVLLIL